MKHCLEKFRHCPSCGSPAFTAQDERSKRCVDCGFEFYLNASAATVAVIYNRQGDILVVRRARHPEKGKLTLPGGFVDHDESIEEGCLREVREETGAEGRIKRFLFSIPNHYPYSGLVVPTVDSFYEVEIFDETAISPNDDAETAFWIPLAELPLDDFAMGSVKEGVRRLMEK